MDVVILGAGVAGVATAIALARLGHTVEIYERRSGAANLGAGITLWPNACFVLDQLGLLPELVAVSGRPTRMQRIDWRGAAIASVDIDAINARLGYPTITVFRRDLQSVLLKHLASAGVTVSYGQAVQEVGETGQRPWATFESGARIECDILLGADGRMASVTRRYVAPESRAVYQGFVNWVGIAAGRPRMVDELQLILDYWGAATRFGIVPISASAAYWAGGQAMSLDAARSTENPRDELSCTFADWPAPVQRVLASSPPDSIRKIAVYDVDPIPCWHRGHVLLIGDAAHASLPTSGQGACQALEDAWHLGRCLQTEGTDVLGAFRLFGELRQAKTRNITLSGRQLARSLFHGTREDEQRRDEIARAADPTLLPIGMASAWRAGLPLAG